MDDIITLRNGRQFYANNLIVGIDANGNVFEGYDGDVRVQDWSDEDRKLLAALMIERWARWLTSPDSASDSAG